MKHLPENERRYLLNQESGKLAWKELQVHFARGVLIYVDDSLDLVSVADTFLLDDKSRLEPWFESKLIQITPDSIANRWANRNL